MTIRFKPNYKILIWQANGLVTLSEISQDIEQIVKIEEKYSGFIYFFNASECDLLNIKFEEVRQIYLLRKSVKLALTTKTAIFAKTTLQYGVARMYQTLMTETESKVEVYRTIQECSDFLEVPKEILFPENQK